MEQPGEGAPADTAAGDVETLACGSIDTAFAAVPAPPPPVNTTEGDGDAMTDVPSALGSVVPLPSEQQQSETKTEEQAEEKRPDESAMEVEPEPEPKAEPEAETNPESEPKEPEAEPKTEEIPEEETERASFLARLHAFMAGRGTPIEHVPVIDRRALDLWQLHRSVARLGGLAAVVENKLWRTVAADLGVDQDRTDAGYRLRMHYEKHLLPFEQHCAGTDNDIPVESATKEQQHEQQQSQQQEAPQQPQPQRPTPRVSARTLRRQMDAANMPSPELVPPSPTTLAMSPPTMLLPPPASPSSNKSGSKKGSGSSRTTRRSESAESARTQQQNQQHRQHHRHQRDEDDDDDDEEEDENSDEEEEEESDEESDTEDDEGDEEDDSEEEVEEEEEAPIPMVRPTHGQGSAREPYTDGLRWHQLLVAAMGRGAVDRLRSHFALAVPLPPRPDPDEQAAHAALLFGASEVDENRALYTFFSALRRGAPRARPGSPPRLRTDDAPPRKRAPKSSRRRAGPVPQ